jgi:hypothetical protein
MSRTLAVFLAAFGLAVGAAGRTEAGPIYTYTFATNKVTFGSAISGSFQVDSSDIGASGNTDISNFIINPEFTFDTFTFTSPNFHPENVTVTSAGDLTMGAGPNRFVGTDTKFTLSLLLNTGGMTGQDYTVTSVGNGEEVAVVSGHWTLLLGQPTPVPEPSTFILAGIGGLGLMAVLSRRRRE